MLSKFLSKTDCAKCRYCCIFDKNDIWEIPLFSEEEVKRLKVIFPNIQFTPSQKEYIPSVLCIGQEMQCPFLNRKSGCELSEEDKPLECKLWPLRIMRRKNEYVLAFEPSCQIMDMYSLDDIRCFVMENRIDMTVLEFALNNKNKVKEYRDNLPIIKTLSYLSLA